MKALTILVVVSCCCASVSSFAAPFRQSTWTIPSRSLSIAPMTADSVSEKGATSTESLATVTTMPEDTAQELLDDALRYNSTAASELLSEINTMRSNNAPQDQIEAFVNNLLAVLDSSSALWTRIRPLARFSRRARLASLRRVLELSTPAASEQDENDVDAEQRRRRRSLVVLLRALAKDDDTLQSSGRVPAVVQLEKTARREARAKFQADDMVNRLPEGLETPNYSVLLCRSGYEVRRYEPFSVCSVAMNKPRKDAEKTDAKVSNPQLAGAGAFGALAGYLFGKNQESSAMKMTTPVLSAGDGDDRQMSFVLPSEYWDGVEEAPKPLDGSGVVLEKKDGGERAVVMFGGFAGKKDVSERTKQLLDGLAKDEQWAAEPGATVTVAQYNDPFTPPWKRRNEVSVEVVRRQDN